MKFVMNGILSIGLALFAFSAQASTNAACNASFAIKVLSSASGITYTGQLTFRTMANGLTEARLENLVPGPLLPKIPMLIGNCSGTDAQATFTLMRSVRTGEGEFIFQTYTGDITATGSGYTLKGYVNDPYTDGPVDGTSN